MLDENVIFIGKLAGDHLSIRFTDGDDVSLADIHASAGGWTGDTQGEFLPGELREFATQVERLYADLVGPIELAPCFPYLTFSLSGDGHGHIALAGKLRHDFARDTYLAFELSLEQTDLLGIAGVLRAVDSK